MMIKHAESERNILLTWTCITIVWLAVIYSSIVQDKYFQIPGGMLLFGVGILVTYLFGNNNRQLSIEDILPRELLLQVFFLVYMLPVGLLSSPNIGGHVSQWVTCLEYLFITIVISSLIRQTDGNETFHLLLLVEAVALAVIFLLDPVCYDGGRYSISIKVNPNGLGMAFTLGVWSALYFNQREKLPLAISIGLSGIFGYCILLTGSRKSLIAALLIFLLWFIIVFLPSLKEKDWIGGLCILIFVAVLVAILGREFSDIYTGSTIAGRMQELQYEMKAGHRSEMYRFGMELFKENPLFGIGFQGFKYYYGLYSHATIVEVPVSGGVIGSLIYFASYLYSLRKCFYIYVISRHNEMLTQECKTSKMLIILWTSMLFYTTCIIHPYQFDSYITYGLIFGQSTVLYEKVSNKVEINTKRSKESKYIR